ncbi:hypothetical protein P7K49_029632 [Saguinus oedipus]|uniref:Uncharacterized protein n=1 Tax=Saguinus oedipus TaxID=9490 RepID=A0ABQ9U7S4_SAGOE|nr:hypothetical protein P7K49_029632 [Saguinus oedipus]
MLGNAWTLKDLVVSVACRSQGPNRKGKIQVYTPATTYIWESSARPPAHTCSAATEISFCLDLAAAPEDRGVSDGSGDWCPGPASGPAVGGRAGGAEERQDINLILQETFMADRRHQRSSPETRVVLNGQEETLQTVVLGYQARHPHVSGSRVQLGRGL